MSFRIATGDESFSLNALNRRGEKKVENELQKERNKRIEMPVEGEVVNKDKLNLNGIEIIYLNN